MKNLLVNDAAGIRSQGNVDLEMSFLKTVRREGEDSRRRTIDSTHLQRTSWFLRRAVQIALIDFLELRQNRLDVSQELRGVKLAFSFSTTASWNAPLRSFSCIS